MNTSRKIQSLHSNATATLHTSKRSGLRRSALLRLAFIVNSLADSSSETDLPIPQVHAAAQDGRLLQLLAQYSRRHPDFSFLQSPAGSFDELNSALRDSSTILRGREFLKAGVYRNGYCLVLALVLYALRERFPQVWPEATSPLAQSGGGVSSDQN